MEHLPHHSLEASRPLRSFAHLALFFAWIGCLLLCLPQKAQATKSRRVCVTLGLKTKSCKKTNKCKTWKWDKERCIKHDNKRCIKKQGSKCLKWFRFAERRCVKWEHKGKKRCVEMRQICKFAAPCCSEWKNIYCHRFAKCPKGQKRCKSKCILWPTNYYGRSFFKVTKSCK